MNQKEMEITEHLEELRKRIIIALSSVMIASVIVYSKILILIEIMIKPLGDYKTELVFFSITEGFLTRFKFSVFIGIVCVSPIIFYQILAFINQGLLKRERVFLYSIIFFLSLFFIFGTLFGYTILLPYALDFLMIYSKSYLTPILSGSMYLGFIGVFCLIIGIVFVIPLFLIVLGKIGIISSKSLRRNRKYILLGTATVNLSFIPIVDLLTFIVIMLPIALLYEISIWIVYIAERRRKKLKLHM